MIPASTPPNPRLCGCDEVSERGLFSIEAALGCIDASVTPLRQTEIVGLYQAKGRILAADVLARSDLPAFDTSAMDGYAVNTDDLGTTAPVIVPLDGRSAAGDTPKTLRAGHAQRILTGAPVPRGANAVLMQERTTSTGDQRVALNALPRSGENIRTRGEEIARGDTVLAAGTRLSARAIAAASAAGCASLPVRRRIRVAILITGAELETAGDTLQGGQIWDINGPALHAALQARDVDICSLAHCTDNADKIASQLEILSGKTDLVITTGGVSVGDEDHLQTCISAVGGEVIFAGVALKPGKPVSFGRIGGCYWLGLPGNPLSALVTWQLFGIAVLDRLRGVRAKRKHSYVISAVPIDHKPGRCEIRPATIVGHDPHGRAIVTCGSATHSGRVTNLPLADGLILIPSDISHLPEGAMLDFIPIDQNDGENG